MKIVDLKARLAEAGDKPVLLFFGSRACGPTLQMFEVLSAFEESHEGSADTIVFEVEKVPEITKACNVRATPTMVVFRNGEPLGNLAGTLSSNQLDEWFANLLLPKKPKKARKKKGSDNEA